MYLWESYSPRNRYAIAPNDTIATEAYCPSGGAEIRVNAALRFSGVFTSDIGQAVRDGGTASDAGQAVRNGGTASDAGQAVRNGGTASDAGQAVRNGGTASDAGQAVRNGATASDAGQAVRNGGITSDMVNAALHFLAHLDLISAVTPETLERDVLSMELRSGAYGEEIRARFARLDDTDRDRLLTYFYKARDSAAPNAPTPDGVNHLFERVFLDFFGRLQNRFFPRSRWDDAYTPLSAEIYYNKPEDALYCYCAAEDNEYNRNCFALLRLLFADYGRDIRPVWGRRCFGVIGEGGPYAAAAPRIGEIQLL